MKLKIVALITVIMAVVVFPVAFLSYEKFYVERFRQSLPPHVRPFADPEPFFSTVYGDFTKVVWVSLGVCWLIIAAMRISKLRLRVGRS